MGLFGKRRPSPIPPALTARTAKTAIMRALEQHDLDYTDMSNPTLQVLHVGFSLDNYKDFDLFVFVDDDGEAFTIRSGVILSVSDEKRARMLEVINDVNYSYRWVRFYIDDENDLIMQCDVDLASSSTELSSLAIYRAATVLDEAYPIFMRAQEAQS